MIYITKKICIEVMEMTIRHLQIFFEVCRSGSITKAAEYLNMTQPAVSRTIRELENYYGIRMFERMNRKLYITEAGEQLRSYADSILGQFEEARVVIRDKGQMTEVRVGVNASYGRSVLPKWLDDFSRQYPKIPWRLIVNNSKVIEDKVLSNELDFGIMDYPENPQFFRIEVLLDERMTAVCAQDFALPEHISIKELEQIPFLVREPGSGSRSYTEQIFIKNNIKPLIRMESISTQSLIEVCKSGLGVLFVPRILVSAYLEEGTLRELQIMEHMERRKYYLVHHKNKYLSKSMKMFRDYVAKAHKDLV